jgi:hypothetical protein
MSTVTAVWDLSVPVNSNLIPGNTVATITGGNAGVLLPAPVTAPVGTMTAVFLNTLPDDPATPYTVTVQMFDNSSPPVPIGLPLSGQVSVSNPAAVVNTPGNLVLTVTP